MRSSRRPSLRRLSFFSSAPSLSPSWPRRPRWRSLDCPSLFSPSSLLDSFFAAARWRPRPLGFSSALSLDDADFSSAAGFSFGLLSPPPSAEGFTACSSRMAYTNSCFLSLSTRAILSFFAISRSSATLRLFRSMMSYMWGAHAGGPHFNSKSRRNGPVGPLHPRCMASLRHLLRFPRAQRVPSSITSGFKTFPPSSEKRMMVLIR